MTRPGKVVYLEGLVRFQLPWASLMTTARCLPIFWGHQLGKGMIQQALGGLILSQPQLSWFGDQINSLCQFHLIITSQGIESQGLNILMNKQGPLNINTWELDRYKELRIHDLKIIRDPLRLYLLRSQTTHHTCRHLLSAFFARTTFS